MNWFDIFIYLYIALRWSAKTLVGCEVYKHLAPPEPEHRCVLDGFPSFRTGLLTPGRSGPKHASAFWTVLSIVNSLF
jgi:hypothetical protein